MKEKIYLKTTMFLSLFIGFGLINLWYLLDNNTTFGIIYYLTIRYIMVFILTVVYAVALFHLYLTFKLAHKYIRLPKANNDVSETIIFSTIGIVIMEIIAFFIYISFKFKTTYTSFYLSSELFDLITLTAATSILGTMIYLQFNQKKMIN